MLTLLTLTDDRTAADKELRTRVKARASALIRHAELALMAASGTCPELGALHLVDAHADSASDMRWFRAHVREQGYERQDEKQ